MMARRSVLAMLSTGAVALLGGCRAFGGSSYRFRMTVEVETPQGLRSGSAVYEVSAHKQPGLDPSGTVRRWKVRGEAVAVDLPGERTLFALLKTVNTAGHDDLAYSSMAALDPKFNYDFIESAGRIASGDGLRSPAQVAPENYPILVAFSDIGDPTNIKRVEPTEIGIRRIIVELTDEPVSSGLEKRLLWLPTVHQTLRGTSFRPDGIPVGDFKGLFSTELAK